jgi:hypothetical protein
MHAIMQFFAGAFAELLHIAEGLFFGFILFNIIYFVCTWGSKK